jgi:hypothetical protein
MEPVLPLQNMADRHPVLTSAVAENYLEAARVCLDRHHESPQQFVVTEGKSDRAIELNFTAWQLKLKIWR